MEGHLHYLVCSLCTKLYQLEGHLYYLVCSLFTKLYQLEGHLHYLLSKFLQRFKLLLACFFIL